MGENTTVIVHQLLIHLFEIQGWLFSITETEIATYVGFFILFLSAISEPVNY